jgi:hypothetical protein
LPTIYLIALRMGGAVAGSLGWYWRLPQLVRQAADARAKEHIEKTYGVPVWNLTPEQARTVHEWATARHA